MKKNYIKILKFFVIMLCCTFLMVAFTGCDFSGKSAYELAVENGYEGTLSEWLESLNGKDGKDGEDGKDAEIITSLYEEAKENGFSGTFFEFLEEYVKGDKGETGETGASGTQVVQYATNKAITSVVSIFCDFEVEETNFWGQTTTSTVTSAGSGVIYSLDKENGNATIITNYHVVYNVNSSDSSHVSKNIVAYVYGKELMGYEIECSFLGGSMNYDIAVLKVEGSEVLKQSNATSAEIASVPASAGDTAVAIGNPEGYGISATSGIVSVDSEYLTMTGVDEVTEIDFRVMRIDAAVNGGNSGGGLFNADGKLIGIVNAKTVATEIENISYAIPFTIAVNVANNIISNYNGTPVQVTKAVIGILVEVTDTISQFNNETKKVEIIQELTITEVSENSAASSGGLQVNDVLVSCTYNGNTYSLTRLFQLGDHLINVKQNNELTLTVNRNGEIKNLNLTINNVSTIA